MTYNKEQNEFGHCLNWYYSYSEKSNTCSVVYIVLSTP